jgi:hypothetical protein
MSQPAFAAYRRVDVVQMIGSGFAFRIAFACVIVMIAPKRGKGGA